MNTIHSIFVVILLIIATYIIYNSLMKIITKIQIGSDETIKNNILDRIILVIKMVFLQKRLRKDKLYGFIHFWFLYGFVILSIGHLELVLYGLSCFLQDYAYLPFTYNNIKLPHNLIIAYNFSQDFFAVMVILIGFLSLYKRIFKKIPRLVPRSKDAEIIIWFIVILYITFFAHTASNISLHITNSINSYQWNLQFPISSLFVPFFIKYFSYESINIIHFITYFMHFIIFLLFACYVPSSKHMHLIFATPNIYLSRINQPIRLPNRIDFENSEEFGIKNVNNISWKVLLDSFACTECGRCNIVCPAYITDKPLSPKQIINNIKLNLYNQDLKKDILIKKEPENSYISLNEIWSCTTCGACSVTCPVMINSIPDTLIGIRRYLILMEAKDYPKELNLTFKGMENQSNPWGIGSDNRNNWCKDLDIPIINNTNINDFEYILYTGCASSTDDKAIKSLQSFAKILISAKIPFATLGKKEKCCGDLARRVGNEYLYESLVEENINVLNKYKLKTFITPCPHCFNQLKNEYKQFNVNYKIKHHSEILIDLIKNNKININKIKYEKDISVTYHDPCYLGRYNNKYNDVRNILINMKIPMNEMDLNKEQSFCCGAGGGFMFMEEKIGTRINKERIKQAEKTKSKFLITACPYCKTMLDDGINENSSISIKDISELLLENIKK